MRRFTILLISIIVAIGCSKESSINFLTGDMTLDRSEHSLVLKTDISITNVFVRSYESGSSISTNISNELTNEGSTLECKGSWFNASVQKSAPKSVHLKVTANDTGKERRLEITVKHLCFQPSTIEIIQKAD